MLIHPVFLFMYTSVCLSPMRLSWHLWAAVWSSYRQEPYSIHSRHQTLLFLHNWSFSCWLRSFSILAQFHLFSLCFLNKSSLSLTFEPFGEPLIPQLVLQSLHIRAVGLRSPELHHTPAYITLHSQRFSAAPFPADALTMKPASLKRIVSGLVDDVLCSVHE